MRSRTRVLALGAVMAVASCVGVRPEATRSPASQGAHQNAVPHREASRAAAEVRSAPRSARQQTALASPLAEPAEGARADTPSHSPDAWAELVAGQREFEQSFDAEFPLHGLAFHMQAQVFETPDAKSPVIGYMRRGARFRATEAERGAGCTGRWHALPEGGHVCTGLGFLISSESPHFAPLPQAPSTERGLPYPYAKILGAQVPQYFRPPTAAELAATRVYLDTLSLTTTTALPTTPSATTAAVTSPALPDPLRMVMQAGFYVSLDARAPSEPESVSASEWTPTVRGAVVPSAALNPVDSRAAPGVALDTALQLPLGFVYRGREKLNEGAREVGVLSRLQAVALDPMNARRDAPTLTTRDGHALQRSNVRLAERATRPALVPSGARWIHVRLSEQTLVAYEGNRPVFATLVTTGQPGFETPTGLFRVHAKHLSTTMDGSAGTDEAYSIEDVPWTMYFDGSYALHGAFWHDRFGQVRSHGCVNLAPEDARWLFRWTTPLLPSGWHGVIATRPSIGTWVFIEA